MEVDEDKVLLNRDKMIGLVAIKDLKSAKQVWIDAEEFKKLVKAVDILVKLGMDKICITVENEHNPVIIGGDRIGIALAPVPKE